MPKGDYRHENEVSAWYRSESSNQGVGLSEGTQKMSNPSYRKRGAESNELVAANPSSKLLLASKNKFGGIIFLKVFGILDTLFLN
jgi:hypothetical protein